MSQHATSDKQDTIIFSLYDLVSLFKVNTGKILLAAIACSLFCGFYTLQKPTVYETQATFKEKERSGSGGIGGSFSQLLGIGGSGRQDNEAISRMRSRSLLEPVVQELNLQAIVSPKGKHHSRWQTLRNNLTVQWAHMRKKQVPVLPDENRPLICHNITYTGSTPLILEIRFVSATDYQIYGPEGEEWSMGKAYQPIYFPGLSFTLSPTADLEPGQEFVLHFSPLAVVADSLAKSINIEPDEDDTNLLKLEFAHPDRHFAARFLNTVMEIYQRFLRTQVDQRANSQLRYLEARQRETDRKLRGLLTSHAETLSNDMHKSGFTRSDREIEFLAHNQQSIKNRLMKLDLELKRIQRGREGGDLIYDTLASHDNAGSIEVVSRIRNLKQQRDSLDLALRQMDTVQTEGLQEGFEQQMAELETVQRRLREVQEIKAAFNKNHALPDNLTILHEKQFLVKPWLERLRARQEEYHVADASEKLMLPPMDQGRDNFTDYLDNLERMFTVHTNIIEERLVHQQKPELELQGIDLATAESLWVFYQKQLNEVQGQIRQHEYISDQMRDPDFDVTSLSIALSDPVSEGMIRSSANLILELRDEQNRTEREQERIKNSLELQREFLTSHVQQQSHLLQLRQNLLNEKSVSLQKTTLDLINQQITILEKHIDDYVTAEEYNLEQERKLLEEDLTEIRGQMAKLPSYWVSERLIDMHMNLSQKTVEEISRLVESKNISHNLEIIESAPVDVAIEPILPRSPKLPLFMMLGACLGAMMMSMFVLLRTIVAGIPASVDNLALSGAKVAGQWETKHAPTVSELSETDLETLRKTVTLLDEENHRTLLMDVGDGFDFSHHLAQILTLQGRKVIIVEAFEGEQGEQGLFNYLKDHHDTLQPTPEGRYWIIPSGDSDVFITELLSSARFKDLLDSLKKSFNDVIVVTKEGPTAAQTRALVATCDQSILQIHKQKLQELTVDKKTIFVLG